MGLPVASDRKARAARLRTLMLRSGIIRYCCVGGADPVRLHRKHVPAVS